MEVVDLKQGLSSEQVTSSRLQEGSNTLEAREERVFGQVVKEVVLEPMFILLLAACIIYFVVGQYREGMIMLVSIFIVAGISLFQEYKSRNAVQALNKLSAARATVVRNGVVKIIPAEEFVVNDLMLLEEGEIVAADGFIIAANDFSLNESIRTGESFSVTKTAENHTAVFKGTLVTSGSATVQVSAVGLKTMFGKIGLSLKEITVVKTPLQQQIRSFVRKMVWVGAVAFLIVVGFNFYESGNLVQSFLQGLTLAMSILPEEIPVAFSTFQALGAFRLLRNNIIVKQPQYVETLGSATVICTDKTGTLTQNKMSIAFLYDAMSRVSLPVNEISAVPQQLLNMPCGAVKPIPLTPWRKPSMPSMKKAAERIKEKPASRCMNIPLAASLPL
jgi:Ca2+-transporting ATPase